MKASVTELEKMELVRGHGPRSSNQFMAGPGPSSQMKAIQGLEHMDSTISFRPWKVTSGIVEEAGEVESQLAQEEVGEMLLQSPEGGAENSHSLAAVELGTGFCSVFI